MKFLLYLLVQGVFTGALVLVGSLMTLPLGAALLVAFLLWFAFRFSSDPYGFALFAGSLFFMFMVAEVGLRFVATESRPYYYRPEEVLTPTGAQKNEVGFHFKRSQSLLSFKMPFGDLAASALKAKDRKEIAEPRVVDFFTDSLGYRNRKEYFGQKWVLFGDSFTVGSGTTQASTLSEQLLNSYQIPTYNAGFPGPIASYVQNIEQFKGLHGENFKAAVLVFEGNDFTCETDGVKAGRAEKWVGLLTYIPAFIQDCELYRLFFGMSRKIAQRLGLSGQTNFVKIQSVQGEAVGFHEGYILETLRAEDCWHWVRLEDSLKSVVSVIDLIVFIPTKYRVYSKHLDPPVFLEESTASRFMKKVSSRLGVQYLDLTVPLQKEAQKLLSQKQYVWWRDDTHWNAAGIAVAAKAIAERITEKQTFPGKD